MGRVPVSLEVLRQEARDELAAIADHRGRRGEDPQSILPDLPSVDELVIQKLRAETIDAPELAGVRARACHPAAGRREIDEFEFQLLRRIALDRPGLTRAVWDLLGRRHRTAA